MPARLGRVLVERKLLTPEQLAEALAHQRKVGRGLVQALADLGLATPEAVLRALGEHHGVPATRITTYTIDQGALGAVPERLARRHTVIPLFRVGTTLTVAMTDPGNVAALDDVRFASGCDVQAVVALEEDVRAAIDRYYRPEAPLPLTPVDTPVTLEQTQARVPAPVAGADEERSASELLDQILARAATDGASDVHLEPQERHVRVRLRVDGVLTEIGRLPAGLAPALAARAKVLAGMDISERRVPQDGRFTATVGSRRLDVRASAYPIVWGEKIVLRLLDRESLRVRLEETGMPPPLLVAYRDLIRRPEGIVLITGPTGSGKTSTLYASLLELEPTGANITTLENPVEYEIEGINQGQTHDRAGFTFATGLRAILRQDPDVILVGEIRDREALGVAIEASLTGHLVFSTLHTHGAVGSVTRLLEMGLEPYLLASTLLGIVAQRLVRRICARCRVEVPTSPEVRRLFPAPGPERVFRGEGCRECRQSGYRGRTGLFEMLRMTDELRDLVLRRGSEEAIASVNRRNGFRTLHEDGVQKVVDGATTLDEVLRVTQARE